MTIFLIFLFLSLLGGKIAVGFYIDSVPFLVALQTPLTVVVIVAGVVMAVFIVIEAINKLRNH